MWPSAIDGSNKQNESKGETVEFLYLLLIVVIIILILIFRKISVLVSMREGFLEYMEIHKNRLNEIWKVIYESKGHLQKINFALNWQHPAGSNSAVSRRKQNLISLYSQYLVKEKMATEEHAKLRSEFEFSLFDNEDLIKRIDDDPYISRKQHEAQKKIKELFFETGCLEKDCEAISRSLIPHDIFAPIWVHFKKNRYVEDGKRKLGIEDHSDRKDYNEYVKQRAIVKKWVDLKIVSKVEGKEKSEAGWLDYPTFTFANLDFERIKQEIYNGPSHNDEHFEERFTQGDLKFLIKPHWNLSDL